MTRQWCIYRVYNAAFELLYVGHTGNLDNRIRCHRRDRRWWDEAEYVFPEFTPDKDEAVEAERQAIRNERPKYNVQLAGPAMATVNFRVSPEVRQAARERAEREGINLTDALRDFLTEWSTPPEK